MTIEPNDAGRFTIGQRMSAPMVYLDHWAVCTFADDDVLGNRFVAALQASRGTWLFSHVNLMEFTAMRDVATARRVETLLQRAFPSLYVLDTVAGTSYFRADQLQRPRDPDAPDRHWMLEDLGRRAAIAGGRLNAHRFISDSIDHADALLPGFEQMKCDIAAHITAIRAEVFANHDRRELDPNRNTRLIDSFKRRVVRGA